MPGTGKTATTLEIIRSLLKNKKMKFDFCHINGM
jgi:Cdc6-like AAA superfamily ATPase